MGFKVRGYTRDVPQEKVRDYSLFAIACEGIVREPDYFRLFDGIDRIKVDIIENSGGSAPSKVLKCVEDYISEYQLDADYGDTLWCVIDKDKWPQDQIKELRDFCNQKDNRYLVISNPSIEIWLLYHKLANLNGLNITTAQDAKRALDNIEKGGYYYIKYLPLMLTAIKNASNADTNPNGYMPKLLQTKVYQLGEALYNRMGKVRFDEFVASLPTIEQEILTKKTEK